MEVEVKKPKEDLNAILKQDGSKTVFVPTMHGAMKIKYENFLFSHHFSRNRVARYRCEFLEKTKCPVMVFVKEGLTYPHNEFFKHNH